MMFKPHSVFFLFSLTLFLGCQSKISSDTGHHQDGTAITATFTAQVDAVNEMLGEINPPAVVYVGEQHDTYGYHLNQLAVIAALKKRGLDVAVGLEMVQAPFQQALDRYIEGDIDFEAMLVGTEFFNRWRIDPRQYQEIFDYARENRMSLVALNAPTELTNRVSEVGIDGLNDAERQILPGDLLEPAEEYLTVLEKVFEEHQYGSSRDVERFVEVQRTWDEVMGKRSVEFVKAHPNHVLVVLAGLQHVVYGHGIPSRVNNDLGPDSMSVIVLSDAEIDQYPDGADVFLPLTNQSLSESGRMGVFISDSSFGAQVNGFVENSPAKDAGMEEEDIIVSINDRKITQFEDVRLALWDKLPGYRVDVGVLRGKEVKQIYFVLE